jgi:hypothetical protein
MLYTQGTNAIRIINGFDNSCRSRQDGTITAGLSHTLQNPFYLYESIKKPDCIFIPVWQNKQKKRMKQ